MALLMLGIVGGGLVAVLSTRDLEPVPVTVGDGVSVTLPGDWSFVSRLDPFAGAEDAVLLTRGSAGLLVYTSRLPMDEALADLRNELAAEPLMTIGEITPDGDLRPSDQPLRFALTGVLPEVSASPIEGEVTAVAGSSLSVVFFAWADVGEYQLVRPEVRSMIAGAVVP